MARIWILALFSMGCDDTDDTGDSGVEEETAAITVTPDALDFGSVPLGGSASLTVDVCSAGEAPLEITRVEIGSASAPFTVSSPADPVLVTPECSSLTVTYNAFEAEVSQTNLWIHSNAEATPRVGVSLTGTGGAPSIAIDPTSIDFGTIWIGCSEERDITITNDGTAELTILGYTFEADTKDLYFSGIPDGLTLDPGQSRTFSVTYTPTDDEVHSSILSITSDDAELPVATSTQVADGSPGGTIEDTFLQAMTRAPDILIAIDRSSSMDGEMESVEANLEAFGDVLYDDRGAYQLAAIVEDNGCVRGTYNFIDDSFNLSTFTSTWETMMDLWADPGEYTQQGFRLLDRAITASAAGGCNEGLVREDSRLHLVGISDGPDQSPYDWDQYVDTWTSSRPSADQIVVHAVGGDWPDGCTGAEAYDGFYQAVEETEGAFLSICSTTWGDELASAVLASIELEDSFVLSEPAIPDSVSVTLDGKPSTTGWTFDPATNTVRFLAAYVPGEGVTITVTYDVVGGC